MSFSHRHKIWTEEYSSWRGRGRYDTDLFPLSRKDERPSFRPSSSRRSEKGKTPKRETANANVGGAADTYNGRSGVSRRKEGRKSEERERGRDRKDFFFF